MGILLVLGGGAYILFWQAGTVSTQPIPLSTVPQPVGDLPNVAWKHQPEEVTFNGCPPEGSGGDSELNLWKNRVDDGKYVDVSFDTLTALTWPKSVEKRVMSDWTKSGRDFVMRYVGIPVTVEGYFTNIKEGQPDPSNCNQANSSSLDWYVSFAKNPKDVRASSVIVNISPRVRANHKWTTDLIRLVVISDHLPVRISGWLFLNPAHPEDVGVTRATIWEVNPVMQIEVFYDGRWMTLDKLAN